LQSWIPTSIVDQFPSSSALIHEYFRTDQFVNRFNSVEQQWD
jgi:hypothetical protein